MEILQKKLRQLKVWNVLMVVETAFAAVLTITFAAAGEMLFGMKLEKAAAPMPWLMLLLLAVFTVLAAVQTILGFRTVKEHRLGRKCYIAGFIAWIVLLIVLLVLIDAWILEWIVFLILIVIGVGQSNCAKEIAKEG